MDPELLLLHPKGETMLGQSASQLAETKDQDEDKVAAVLKAAQWQVPQCAPQLEHALIH